MLPPWRKNAVHLLAAAAAFLALSCGERATPTSPRMISPGGASKAISDGTHSGNPNVFFLPPMVPNPVGQPGYGGAFAAGLAVTMRIVDVTTNTQLGGVPSAVTMSLTDQLYQASWDTKASVPALNSTDTYRVEVWVGAKRIAWADVNVVSNGSELKNATTGDAIPLLDGRTLPIKVRIEEGWDVCLIDANCVSQVVPATIPSGTTVKVQTPDQKDWIVFHGGADGTWNNLGQPVVVTIENVSTALGGTIAGCEQGLTTMVVDPHCLKITTDPKITLTTDATVCMTSLPTSAASDYWLMLKYNVGETTKFLAESPAGACMPPAVIGAATQSSNPLIRLASRVGSAVRRFIMPNVAYAFDLGVGALLTTGDGFSFFAPGAPATMSKVAGTDNQLASVGGTVPVRPAVQLLTTHHHAGDPVTGAVVTCKVTGGGGSIANGGAATEEVEFPGTYTCPAWTLGPTAGTNTLKVTANLLDSTAAGGSASFTATGTALPNPIIALKSTQSVVIGGVPGTQYNLTVTNRSSYPDQLFAATSGVTCGANTSASRMWADIYNANGDAFLNGFCTLGTAAGLDAIYFVVSSGAAPPASVYLKLTDKVTNTVYTSNTLSVAPPTPALAYTSSEQYAAGDLLFDRYSLTVTNYSAFSQSLFDPIPGATTCISKTTVNMLDGSNNFVSPNAFCGLASPSDLQTIWVAVPRWTQPPSSVHITLVDQASNTLLATSNAVQLYGPVFTNYPRTLNLSWPAVSGAVTYSVVTEYCSNWASPDWRTCTTGWLPWTTQTVTAPTTNVDNTFVGDQPGRWRAIARDANNAVISTSPDKFFKFVTAPSP